MSAPITTRTTRHRTVIVDGAELFFRQAGDPARPAVVLLDTGHFALVEALEPIAAAVDDLLTRAYA